MVYGKTLDGSGNPLGGVWVQLKQGSNTAVVKSEIDGSYLFFEGQGCPTIQGIPEDGLYTCSGWTSTTDLVFGNGNVSTTVSFLGNDVLATATPTFPTGFIKADVTTPTQVAPLATVTAPAYTFSASKGTAYPRSFKFKTS